MNCRDPVVAVHPYKGQLGVIKTPGTFACGGVNLLAQAAYFSKKFTEDYYSQVWASDQPKAGSMHLKAALNISD